MQCGAACEVCVGFMKRLNCFKDQVQLVHAPSQVRVYKGDLLQRMQPGRACKVPRSDEGNTFEQQQLSFAICNHDYRSQVEGNNSPNAEERHIEQTWDGDRVQKCKSSTCH